MIILESKYWLVIPKVGKMRRFGKQYLYTLVIPFEWQVIHITERVDEIKFSRIMIHKGEHILLQI